MSFEPLPIDLWPCDYCPPGPCEGRRGSVLCIGRSLTLETEYSFRTYTREVTSFPPCGVHGSLHLPLSLSTKRAHGMRHITSSSRRSSCSSSHMRQGSTKLHVHFSTRIQHGITSQQTCGELHPVLRAGRRPMLGTHVGMHVTSHAAPTGPPAGCSSRRAQCAAVRGRSAPQAP